jgi:hypothetical protein
MALFTTALNLYGGVLWSGELQGFIAHERVPSTGHVGRRPKPKGEQRRHERGGWHGVAPATGLPRPSLRPPVDNAAVYAAAGCWAWDVGCHVTEPLRGNSGS